MMMVTQRAVARGLARSASISRRARTSAATDSARPSRTLARPAPRRRAPRIRLAAIDVAGGVVQVVGEARAARPRWTSGPAAGTTSRATSGRIGSGVERRVAMQRLLEADPDGQHPGQGPGPLLHRLQPVDPGRRRRRGQQHRQAGRGGRAGPGPRPATRSATATSRPGGEPGEQQQPGPAATAARAGRRRAGAWWVRAAARRGVAQPERPGR